MCDERPIVRKRSATFEESNSFDRMDSDEDEAPASFPNSPVRRASISSRIPRAKPTTPSQHIAEIRKSISVSSKTVDAKSHSKCKGSARSSTHKSRVDQFNAIGVAYQKVFSVNGSSKNDLKPATVTLRNRPSSAKESTKRLSAPVPDSLYHASSLPSSPKHGAVTGLAPGVRKRIALSKCISVDETAPRRNSNVFPPSAPNQLADNNVARRSSLSDPRRSPYRASYPNRSLASVAIDSLNVKPRGQRRGSLSTDEHTRPEKRERPSSERATGHARKNSVVKKRLPKGTVVEQDRQVKQTLKETKQTVENAARMSHVESANSRPIGTVRGSLEDKTGETDNTGISIVRKTNKTENIKIHLGKAIDKSVEKSTTVSVTIEGDKKQAKSVNQGTQQPYGLGRSLLTKVKQLAEEIETLAMLTSPDGSEAPDSESKQSFPHSCSTPAFGSETVHELEQSNTNALFDVMNLDHSSTNRPLWDQDTFSETEYLSIDMRSPRNGRSPTIEE